MIFMKLSSMLWAMPLAQSEGPPWWGKCRFPRILGLGILFVPQGLYIFLVPVVPIGFASFWIWDSHKLQGKK